MERRSKRFAKKDNGVAPKDASFDEMFASVGGTADHDHGERAFEGSPEVDDAPEPATFTQKRGASSMKPTRSSAAEEAVENCPLFTDIPLSKVRAIEINGMANTEEGPQAFFLGSEQPTLDKAQILREYGGGTFTLRAIGEGGQPLEECKISIAGPSLWMSALEGDEDDDDRDDDRRPQVGARYAADRDPRGRGRERDRDPRDDRFGRGRDPRYDAYGDPYGQRGFPYGGQPPWGGPRTPPQAPAAEQITNKLLEAFIGKPAADSGALQTQIESMRAENERLRASLASQMQESTDMRRRLNSEIDDERQRSQRYIRELEDKLASLRGELQKEQAQKHATERRMLEMELQSKFAGKDGGGGGFDPQKFGPLMPIIGMMVAKWMGLSPDEAAQLAAEQSATSGGASGIPGIPSE